MKVDGIAVDLIFVSLSGLDSVPEALDVLDDQLLRGLDDPSVRSINGVRVTERILRLVPNQARFRTALVAIKHWARVRYERSGCEPELGLVLALGAAARGVDH